MIGIINHTGTEVIRLFIRIEAGKGFCKMEAAEDNDAVFVPADLWHNITNTGDEPLKLYTIYAGPDHLAGTVHPTHEDTKNDSNEQD